MGRRWKMKQKYSKNSLIADKKKNNKTPIELHTNKNREENNRRQGQEQTDTHTHTTVETH